MLMHITKSMHLIEMMNFLLYIVTNLSSLVLLCSQRYKVKRKSDGETRSLEVSEMDYQRNILQGPQLKEMPQRQELASTPIQVPKEKPTVGCFDTPCCRGSRYGIHPPPIEAEAYEIKTSLVRLIQESRFLGTKVENPYDHLDSFERLCDTFRTGGVPHDSIKLILFPFSLGGKASQWEKTLPSHLVNSWDDCKEIFLNKFYSTQRTVQTRREILNFKQGMHESFHKAWGRLKGYTRDCPHHGFKKEAILSIFYLGVDQKHKWTLDAASNGRFTNLTVERGELLVENFSQSEENNGEDYYRFPLGSGRHEDQGREEIKALHEKIDKQNYAVFTKDSDIQEGEGCALHDQAEKQKLEVKFDHPTRPTDRVKPSVMQPQEISNLTLLISNPPNELSNDIGEDLDKTVKLLWKTPLEAEEVIQEFDLLSECTIDENPVLRYAARIGTVTTLSYPPKNSGEAAGIVGKALEHPCEGVIVVECIPDKHLGITSTNAVSIAEPRTILFEKIRMKEYRGWFYDEYDPGDTWIHC